MSTWRDDFFIDEQTVLMKKQLEEFIQKGNSVEEAFSVVQEEQLHRYEEQDDDAFALSRLYLPLAALQLQYGTLQEDVYTMALSLLSQEQSAPFSQEALLHLKQRLAEHKW
ncbi:hypothetical protein ACFDTO_24430 [Microbacteriaceae bacterium 4G12]